MGELAIGWAAGAGSAIAFGSFGVPLKSPAVVAARVDPLVLQTYKTAVCFITSWIALAFVPFQYTWWGVLGSSIWILTGTVAIIAIQKAGLGLAQAIWIGVALLVATWWGVVIFHEPVTNRIALFMGILTMGVGLCGVAWCANKAAPPAGAALVDGEIGVDVQLESKPLRAGEGGAGEPWQGRPEGFTLGLLCAVLTGVLAGSSPAPLKFANRHVSGMAYMISFGIGAAIANTVVGAVYLASFRWCNRPMPSFHIKTVGLPGCLAGLLWSLGNFLGIICIERLGISLAMPLATCQLIVAALWGFLLYGEGGTWRNRLTLMVSCIILLSGAVLMTRYGLS
eukprot:jgi/Botrbrau1/22365/Bobra.0002s0042.1